MSNLREDLSQLSQSLMFEPCDSRTLSCAWDSVKQIENKYQNKFSIIPSFKNYSLHFELVFKDPKHITWYLLEFS